MQIVEALQAAKEEGRKEGRAEAEAITKETRQACELLKKADLLRSEAYQDLRETVLELQGIISRTEFRSTLKYQADRERDTRELVVAARAVAQIYYQMDKSMKLEVENLERVLERWKGQF